MAGVKCEYLKKFEPPPWATEMKNLPNFYVEVIFSYINYMLLSHIIIAINIPKVDKLTND